MNVNRRKYGTSSLDNVSNTSSSNLYGGYMKTQVEIIQLNTVWLLMITTSDINGIILVNRYTFDKLHQALQAACILRLHVDNNNVLPIKQYKTVA